MNPRLTAPAKTGPQPTRLGFLRAPADSVDGVVLEFLFLRLKKLVRQPMRALGLVALLWPAGNLSAQPLPDWLEDVNRAFSDLNYDGVFSYFTGEDLVTLRIVHMVVDGERRERVVQLNGAPREIIRKGDEVISVLMPGDNLAELSREIAFGSFARAFAHRFDRVSGFYAITELDPGRIAGRPARQIAVTPKDDNRYGYRLWLDAEHQLPLRLGLLDQDGSLLEVFQFTQITIGDEVSPAELEPGTYEGAISSLYRPRLQKPAEAAATPVPWRPGWIPVGFSMTVSHMRDVRFDPSTQRQPVSAMMYSDGMSAFSLFVEERPKSGAAAMVSRRGATIILTDFMLHPFRGQVLVTLVGELPEVTARRIARSVRHASDTRE